MGNRYVPTSIKAEGLSDLATGKSCSARQRAVACADDIISSILTGPPCYQARRHGNASRRLKDGICCSWNIRAVELPLKSHWSAARCSDRKGDVRTGIDRGSLRLGYNLRSEERSDGDDPSLRDVVRTWFNEGNFQRLARANQLAEQKGVGATQIALAYVLSQPFPVFALIGPHSIEETRTSLEALSVQLTTQEMSWLNLED